MPSHVFVPSTEDLYVSVYKGIVSEKMCLFGIFKQIRCDVMTDGWYYLFVQFAECYIQLERCLWAAEMKAASLPWTLLKWIHLTVRKLPQ